MRSAVHTPFRRALAALVLIMGMMPIAARADPFGDLDISYTPDALVHSTHGYQEHRFDVHNRSPTRSHELTLILPASHNGSAGTSVRVSRTVVVGPGASMAVRIPQPPLIVGYGVAVVIDGRRADEQLLFSFDHGVNLSRPTYRFGSGSGTPTGKTVLVGDGVNADLLRRALEPPKSSTPSYATPDINVTRSLQPIARWSDEWLAYSRYDAVVLRREDANHLPGPARAAIDRYVDAGGVLVIVGAENDNGSPAPSMVEHHHGFGVQFDMTKLTDALAKRIAPEIEATARPWSLMRSIEQANSQFPVEREMHVPVRGLLALMLVFAAVIGPVNLVVLSKKKRRIWLLWTAPALGLAFSGIVFGYNLLAEGWTGHRRTHTFTILDQVHHRATTLGWTAFYCPLTPGDGAHFSIDTELSPQWMNPGWMIAPSRACTVEWTRDQHLASGWISARTPVHFVVRKAATQRQRIEITPAPGGTFTALNGLSVTVTSLDFADDDGRVFHAAGPIEPGHTAALAPAGWSASVSRNSAALRGVYNSDWLAVHDAKSLLSGGDYFATVSGDAFLEPGVASTVAVPETCEIYGVLR